MEGLKYPSIFIAFLRPLLAGRQAGRDRGIHQPSLVHTHIEL